MIRLSASRMRERAAAICDSVITLCTLCPETGNWKPHAGLIHWHTAPINGRTLGAVRLFRDRQLGWFACVLSAARDVPWMGVATTIVLVAMHLARVDRPLQEFKLLVSVLVVGAIWESVPVATGLLVYPNGTVLPGAAPYWILALWALFAVQFNTTFGWLKQRMLLASVLGAIAGPMSFRAGAALGAVRLVLPLPATILLAIGWAFLMPVLILLSRRWDGVHVGVH